MKKWKGDFVAGWALIWILLQLAACRPSDTVGEQPADWLFQNGRIYTMAAPEETAEALAIKGERILFAGPGKDAERFIGPQTRIIDLMGKTLLPGFTDAHVHPVSGGLALAGCNLADILDRDSVLTAIRRYAHANPDKEWIRADNFWLPAFPDGNPRREWLDRIVPDRPAYVTSSDGHSAWVNTKALRLAGVTAATPDPSNGRIERDPVTREPSGALREEAMELVSKLIPKPTHEELVAALKRSLRLANSLGITNLVEASASEGYIETYLELARQGELTAHVGISIYGDVSKGAEGAATVARLNEKYKTLLAENPALTADLRFDQVKLFMDGVVEGTTAAMLEPYAHQPDNRGIANADPETANEAIAALDKAGIQVHVHAIGDRGIRMTLDAFENARQQNGIRDSRHHIAHLHVVHPDDIPRFKTLDVTANFQALWATLEDTYMTDLNFPYLGKERSEWQYPIGTLARSGARVVFGSDWDVSTMDPFDAMQVAVTRRGPDSLEREPWTPQHLADVWTVAQGYTSGGAWLTFREQECGTLEPGKLADLIVLDRDVFTCSRFEIYNTEVVMTLFRGKVVYEK
ncbi:MAG TPA: amidohydrolase [Flavilitoribacter sp.]|nr:amidohydrolase [Flavilitoribacter sp.]HMQ86834.1 amidohydrolase [Flavilitoribacter sp.]